MSAVPALPLSKQLEFKRTDAVKFLVERSERGYHYAHLLLIDANGCRPLAVAMTRSSEHIPHINRDTTAERNEYLWVGSTGFRLAAGEGALLAAEFGFEVHS